VTMVAAFPQKIKTGRMARSCAVCPTLAYFFLAFFSAGFFSAGFFPAAAAGAADAAAAAGASAPPSAGFRTMTA